MHDNGCRRVDVHVPVPVHVHVENPLIFLFHFIACLPAINPPFTDSVIPLRPTTLCSLAFITMPCIKK